MIYNAKTTLYLYFDSQLSRLRSELEERFYFIAYKRLKDITDEDLTELLKMSYKIEVMEKVFVELNTLF